MAGVSEWCTREKRLLRGYADGNRSPCGDAWLDVLEGGRSPVLSSLLVGSALAT